MNKRNGLLLAAVIVAVIAGCSESGSDGSGPVSPPGGQTGTGGSTARMTIAGNYLYAIAGSEVQLFNIETASAPNPWVRVQVSWNIETLFPYRDGLNQDYLLIGASDGMHILDNTDPGAPEYIVDFPHAQAQDPVVAENGIAYVTLKDSFDNQGNSGVNQLNVIDINTIVDPRLLDTIPMQGPTGLSVDNEYLFVCDDIAGIKIFDTRDPLNLSVLDFIPDVVCNDVIAQNFTLFVITDSSVLQYDYSTLPAQLISQVSKSF